MKRSYYIIITLLYLSASCLYAQQKLTLEQCRHMALENNKQIKMASGYKEKAYTDRKAYRANYFPKLSLTGNYLFTNTDSKLTIPGGYLPTFIPGPDGQLLPNILSTLPNGDPIFKEYAYMPDSEFRLDLNNSYTAGVKAEQPIFMGGKIVATNTMAKIAHELSELNENLTNSETLVLTDEAFWSYVKASELFKVAEQYKALISELLHTVKSGHEIGMIQRNDLLKVQVKLNEAELQLRKAENAIHLAGMNLCHIIGLPLDSNISVDGTYDTTIPIVNLQADISKRPDFAMLDKQVALKQQQVRLVRSDFLPNVGIAAMYNYTHGLKINDRPMFDNSSFSAVISVKIPLFQWGEGRNKVRSARIEQKITELKQIDANEKMELELMKAINDVDEALFETTLTKSSLAEAEENLKIHKDMYETGMATLTDYLEAQTSWQKASTDCVNANAALQLAQTKYLKASGEL